MEKMIEITLVRGLAARSKREKATVRSLGLRKPGQKVIRKADPCTLGMVRKVAHLVQVREVGEVES